MDSLKAKIFRAIITRGWNHIILLNEKRFNLLERTSCSMDYYIPTRGDSNIVLSREKAHYILTITNNLVL